jgi:hypothetical protein
MSFISGMIFGIFLLLGYMVKRMLSSSKWDDSNITNALRVISHVVAHPDDLGKMQYEDGTKPFWYINKDEFSEVVNTRPEK